MYFKKLIFEEQSLIYEYFNKRIFIDILNNNEQKQAEDIAKLILVDLIPISKLLKFKHFWKFKLYTNEHTLDPRSDTELLIEILLKKFKKEDSFSFIELGIGTGAISISILYEFPNSHGIGIEISSEAINISQYNLNQYISNWQERYQIIQNNWLENINTNFDLCISNPPYLTQDECKDIIDPHLALYGGIDGCDFYRKISEKQHLFRNIILEIGNINILSAIFAKYELYYDYKNLPRCLVLQSNILENN